MNSSYFNLKKVWGLMALAMLLSFNACDIDPVDDPNNPSESSIVEDASLGEIQNVVDGIFAGMRNSMQFYWEGTGVIGREIYRFSGSDPRYTSDLLGKCEATLDDNTFYTTNPFTARYRTVKNCNILLQAIANTKAALTTEERSAAAGFAKTIKAYELLIVLNEQYTNGIRVDVSDPDNLGAFLSKDESYNAIANLLHEAEADIEAAGTADFPFKIAVAGFGNFSTPAEFHQFLHAILARVHTYQGLWDEAAEALDQSFLDKNGDLNYGAYYSYSTRGGDLLNPVYYTPGANGETIVANPSFAADAEPGDQRLSKVLLRDTIFQDGLSSTYDFSVYKSNSDAIPIIRNEELILILAEAAAHTNKITEARECIDRVRTAAGLQPYTGEVSESGLVDEILKQRRYSLYGEGHRWIDMRRYNRLGDLPLDRLGDPVACPGAADDVWTEFPRPANEE